MMTLRPSELDIMEDDDRVGTVQIPIASCDDYVITLHEEEFTLARLKEVVSQFEKAIKLIDKNLK